MEKMTRPNCIYGDVSIDDAEDTFFHCERCVLERRNLEIKVGVVTIENFCNVILSSEENWNNLASYAEVLLKTKKFDLNERSRMDNYTASRILLRNPDVDVDIKEPNGQTDSTSK